MVPWLSTVGLGQVTSGLRVRHWNWGVSILTGHGGIVLALQAATPASPPPNKAVSSASPHSQRRRVQRVFLVPWEKGRAPAVRGGWSHFTEGRVEFLVSRFTCGRNARALLRGNPESTLSPARPLRQKHTGSQSQVEGLPGVLWEALRSLGVPCLCSPTTGSHPVCLVLSPAGRPHTPQPYISGGGTGLLRPPWTGFSRPCLLQEIFQGGKARATPCPGLGYGDRCRALPQEATQVPAPTVFSWFLCSRAWEALPWPKGLLCPGLEPLPCCSALSSLEARKRCPFPSPTSLSLASLPQVMGTNFQAR